MNYNETFSEYLIFAWWNTNLSTLRGKPSENHGEKLKLAQQIISYLIATGVDFIGLAEVSDEDLQKLHKYLAKSKYAYECIEGTKRVGKTKFDLGIFYNSRRISVLKDTFLTTKWAHSNVLKIALQVDIFPHIGNSPFSVFVSHWPSLLSEPDKREQYGFHLRSSINEILSSSKSNCPYIIVMGDFNYEPFDKVLSADLLATRDRTMASSKRDFLYNPFWRHLGEKNIFDKHHSWTSEQPCGTYFYKNGQITRWYTFDQIMFSSTFLSFDEWYLDEKYSLIWENEILSVSLLRENQFDHLPIISAVALNS